MKRYYEKNRVAPTQQRFWMAKAEWMAKAGFSYWEIRHTIPRLRWRSIRKLRIMFTREQRKYYPARRQTAMIKAMVAAGMNYHDIAKIYGFSKYQVHYHMRKP